MSGTAGDIGEVDIEVVGVWSEAIFSDQHRLGTLVGGVSRKTVTSNTFN